MELKSNLSKKNPTKSLFFTKGFNFKTFDFTILHRSGLTNSVLNNKDRYMLGHLYDEFQGGLYKLK